MSTNLIHIRFVQRRTSRMSNVYITRNHSLLPSLVVHGDALFIAGQSVDMGQETWCMIVFCGPVSYNDQHGSVMFAVRKKTIRVRYESCNICRFFMNEWCMDYLFPKVVETQTSATLFCFEVAVAITNSQSNRIRTNQVCLLLGSQCYAYSSID